MADFPSNDVFAIISRADAQFFAVADNSLRVRARNRLAPASAMKAHDDATLLQAVARRDEAAFSELYDRFSRPVFSLIVRMLRSRAEAEEILQEAFWQVWERAPDYRVELGSAFCWVVTIARRKAIDRLRANTRHLNRIEQAQGLRADDDFVSHDALETLTASERGTAVQAALARINLAERRAIALAFLDGLTHEEIAQALREPVGTIKARIRRGMLKLKPALARLRQAHTP
jgi:RNA polymerase sigma-70 factor, ECF subfamily